MTQGDTAMTSTARDAVIRALPYVRRYARALTGDQVRGDAMVAEALRRLGAASPAQDPLLVLYAEVTRQHEALAEAAEPAGGLDLRARALLLLTALEGLTLDAAAGVLGIVAEEAGAALAVARGRLREAAAADVLIIEDEPIIAMDLEELVQSCGHRVVGVASSEREALEISRRSGPGLILADINLGAGGDGASAVARIIREHPAPVIYVTAYPERLLTGEAAEPAFVITKPFEPLTLAIATYQAVSAGLPLS